MLTTFFGYTTLKNQKPLFLAAILFLICNLATMNSNARDVASLNKEIDDDIELLNTGESIEEPIEKLKKIGVRAVPALLKAANDPYMNALAENAVQALASINAPDVIVPILIQHSDKRGWAVRAGQTFGLAAMPALQQAVISKDVVVREEALQALVNISAPSIVMPVLLHALEDNNKSSLEIGNLEEFHSKVCDAIIELISTAKTNLPASTSVSALIRVIKSAPSALRNSPEATAAGLGVAALPATLDLLKSSEEEFRLSAVRILSEMRPETKGATTGLAFALKDSSKEVRQRSIDALGRIGPAASNAVPAIVQAIGRGALEDDYIEASEAVNRIGVAGIPALVQAAKDGNNKSRAFAIRALSEYITGQRKIVRGTLNAERAHLVTPALIGALDDQANDIRQTAIEALEQLGDLAIPALKEALLQKNTQIRFGAASVLGKLHAETKTSVPLLIEALGKADPIWVDQAVQALEAIGPEAKSAVPALIKILSFDPPQTRIDYGGGNMGQPIHRKVAQALGAIGPDAKAAVPALVQMALHGQMNGDDWSAAQALGRIGPEAHSAVPILIQMIKRAGGEPFVYVNGPGASEKAAFALGEIGAMAKPALPTLFTALLKSRDGSRTSYYSDAVAKIAKKLQEANDTTAIPTLEKGLGFMEDYNLQPSILASVRRPLDFLKAEATAGRGPPPTQDEVTRCQNLIVQITGELDKEPVIGTGIIFGSGNDRLYIATARHVVRRATFKISGLKAYIKSLPGEPLDAELTEHNSPELDLAVLVVRDVQKNKIPIQNIPFNREGKPQSLTAGEKVYALGLPMQQSELPVRPDEFMKVVGSKLLFQSQTVQRGYSGGALFNANWQLVGMIRADEPPFIEAIAIDQIHDQLKDWGYPVNLSRNP